MCGIDLVVVATDSNDNNELEDLNHSALISHRGPDSCHTIKVPTEFGVTLTLTASVLQIRGCVKQPVELVDTQKDCYLCWNGELYNDGNDSGSSDTLMVASLIQESFVQHDDKNTNDDEQQQQQQLGAMAQILSTLIHTEYAIVVTTPHSIYYARDVFGRRSLLSLTLTTNDESPVLPAVFRLSSVATSCDWKEIPPGILYCYSFKTRLITEHSILLPTIPLQLPTTTIYPQCPNDCSITMWHASFQLEHFIQQAVQRRLQHPSDGIHILFSGGIDSVVLASMACRCVATTATTTIHLHNISFDGNRSKDRLAAMTSHANLQLLYPTLSIQLHCIDKTWDDIQAKEEYIKVLLYPKTSLMDMNIGCALWFAASFMDYGSSKVVLVGMGADEQMGGYTRHRVAAKNSALREELTKDTMRLWERNLGRDDRLISDHGKEARFPYLDTNVVQFLQSLPVEDICDFALPPGEGDKRILRLIAQRHGLVECSGLVKRAIQFGSRISHVSDAKRFGSRRKAKGEKKYDDDGVARDERAERVTVHGDGTVVVHK